MNAARMKCKWSRGCSNHITNESHNCTPPGIQGCLSPNAEFAHATVTATMTGCEINEHEHEYVLDGCGSTFANLAMAHAIVCRAMRKLLVCCATFVPSATSSRNSQLSFNHFMVCSNCSGKWAMFHLIFQRACALGQFGVPVRAKLSPTLLSSFSKN